MQFSQPCPYYSNRENILQDERHPVSSTELGHSSDVQKSLLQYLTVTQSEAFSDANWVWEVVQININDIQK